MKVCSKQFFSAHMFGREMSKFTPNEKRNVRIASVVLGIFTLGIVHTVCALIFLTKNIKVLSASVKLRLPSSNPKAPIIKSKQPPIIKPEPIDENKNYFKHVPNDIINEILKFLDPLSILNFSVTNKKNLKMVQDKNPNNKLLAKMEGQALEIWKEASVHVGHEFIESTALLMKFYPTQVTEALEKAIKDDEDIDTIVQALQECAAINPKMTVLLLEKAYVKSSESKYLPATLHYLANAFSSIDPERALIIANQISEPNWSVINWKFESVAMIASKFIPINPERSFVIANNIPIKEYRIRAFEAILEGCTSLDKEMASSIIERVQKEAEAYLRETSLIKPEILYPQYMLESFAKAYSLANDFDKALKAADKIKSNATKIRVYLSIVKQFTQKMPDQVIPILDQVLELDHSDEMAYEVAEAFIKLNLKKAMQIKDQIKDAKLKTNLLVNLAEKYKSIDKQFSMQLLEQAILLVDQIKRKPRACGYASVDASNISALAKIARHFASIDPKRGKEIIEKGETMVKKVGIGDDGFHAMQVIPPLAEACIFIDPARAVQMVNENLDYMSKAITLLKLSKMLKIKGIGVI